MRPAAPIAAMLLTLAAPACRIVTPPGTTIATTPPGARVEIDGRDTGFVTPCNISLDGGGAHQLRLTLAGYATTDLYLDENLRIVITPWLEGQVHPRTFRFPIFHSMQGFFLPLLIDQSPSPGRIHVQMRLAAQE